jgi:hypothetical protein
MKNINGEKWHIELENNALKLTASIFSKRSQFFRLLVLAELKPYAAYANNHKKKYYSYPTHHVQKFYIYNLEQNSLLTKMIFRKIKSQSYEVLLAILRHQHHISQQRKINLQFTQ